MTPQQAVKNYHWVKYDEATNTVELYLDNFMLSGARLCEAKFYLEHMLKVKPRYAIISASDKVVRKPWFFDFGEYIHWCLEQFYNHFKIYKTPPVIDAWMDICKVKWKKMKMDDYANSISSADVKKYEEVKGWEGVCGLLIQYYAFYMDMRLRVIDTEITFGHNKEVLIGYTSLLDHEATYIGGNYGDHIEHKPLNIMCYLTGRIDLLVDNGYKIGPVDHKSTHSFDGYEHQEFNPHDGITGYILAIHEILKNTNRPYASQMVPTTFPQCMGGWIFHLSAKALSTPRDKSKGLGPRFKTTPVDKTIIQLEDYKARQLSTFKRIAELLFNDKVPEWNTISCNNIFFRPCEYKAIHEQPSNEWPSIIERFYTIGDGWNTLDHSNKEK